MLFVKIKKIINRIVMNCLQYCYDTKFICLKISQNSFGSYIESNNLILEVTQ